jgi:hypothetical protein
MGKTIGERSDTTPRRAEGRPTATWAKTWIELSAELLG